MNRRLSVVAIAIAVWTAAAMACGLSVSSTAGGVGVDAAPDRELAVLPEAAPEEDASPPVVDAAPDAWSCDGGTMALGHCYLLRAAKAQPQPQAKTECATLGGHLVTIAQAAENDVVQRLAAGELCWIGLEAPPHPMNDAGAFQWITSEPVTFEGWTAVDPDGDQSCVVMNDAGQWADRDCVEKHASVCEFE